MVRVQEVEATDSYICLKQKQWFGSRNAELSRSGKIRAEERIKWLAKTVARSIRVASFVHILFYMWDECKAGRQHGACVDRLLVAGVHIVIAGYGDAKCFLRLHPPRLLAALLAGLHMPSNRIFPNHPTRERIALEVLWHYLDVFRVWPIALSYAPNLKKNYLDETPCFCRSTDSKKQRPSLVRNLSAKNNPGKLIC